MEIIGNILDGIYMFPLDTIRILRVKHVCAGFDWIISSELLTFWLSGFHKVGISAENKRRTTKAERNCN